MIGRARAVIKHNFSFLLGNNFRGKISPLKTNIFSLLHISCSRGISEEDLLVLYPSEERFSALLTETLISPAN